MFVSLLGTQLKLGFRNKSNIFWTLMFPIILGTLFYVAFGHIYEQYAVKSINTAVVFETEQKDVEDRTRSFLEGLTVKDQQLLILTYTDHETALSLLKEEKKVTGIIRVDKEGMLTLELSENGVLADILENVVNTYNRNVKLVKDVAEKHPEKLIALIAKISLQTSHIVEKDLAGENKDPFVSYFYNLLAMTALSACYNSVRIGYSTMANQSAVGARVNVAPVKKTQVLLAAMLASFIVQTLVIEVAAAYLVFVLKIKMGSFLMITLTSAFATFLGVALGFVVGNAGSLSISKKEGILVALVLLSCAMSGLMMGDVKVIFVEKAPLVNKINPAAVISDAFYSLNMFGASARYQQALIYMVAIAIILTILGLVLGRRNNYDSV